MGYEKLSVEQLRQARANYYDSCAEVDWAIGQILDSLDRTGLTDQTIVVFTTDHGHMLGEHGLGEKNCFYEPVVRVPCNLSAPNHLPTGTVLDDPVEQIDLLPTLLAMAGIAIPRSHPQPIHGRNLMEQLQGVCAVPDRSVFSEIRYTRTCCYPEFIRRQGSPHHVMVRQGCWKLTCAMQETIYGPDAALYNLQDDPGEMNNRHGDPDVSDLQANLYRQIEQWMQQTSAGLGPLRQEP